MELVAGDRLGKYEVVGRLAAGGMAEVYLARSLGHGGFAKAVALKRMLPSLAGEPGFREMFMQEASLAARLSHPHVVQIFDFAEEHGELYLAMELVHGVNLRQLHVDAMKRARSDPALRLPPMLAASIARGVARALGYAWTLPDEKGAPLHLIHRDVSPHNVLLSWQGDFKLADFGIAKPAGKNSSAGTVKGKLRYMAPEQLLGGRLDARSDLFALGIVLYETALGHAPIFDAKDVEGIKRALQSRVVTPPVRVDPDFPPLLSRIIMKALERDPERRFQSGVELADALGESLHREARSPGEVDLAAFMARMYGGPSPLPGLGGPEPSADVPRGAPLELERVANDGMALTIAREAASGPGESTVISGPHALSAGEPTEAAADKLAAIRQQRATLKDRGQDRHHEARPPSVVVAEQEPGVVSGTVLVGAPLSEPRAGAGPRSRRWVLAVGLLGVLAALGAAWAAMAWRSPSPRPAAPWTPRPIEGGSKEPKLEPVSAAGTAREAGVVTGNPPASAARSGAAPLPGPTPAAPAAKGAAAASRAPKKGTLIVHVRPWVYAWVDGEAFTGGVDQEAAPRLTRELSAGRHLVYLRDAEGQVKKVVVAVPAAGAVTIEGVFDQLDVR